MKDYQKRVIKERDELQKKIDNLFESIATEVFINLPFAYKDMLMRQDRAMREYIDILDCRISLFE